MFADEFVGREALEGLEPASEVVGVDEVPQIPPQVFVSVIVEALDGCVLDGAVHALDLPVGPRMIDLGEPVLDAVLAANPVEDMEPVIFMAGVTGELDAVVGQHRMDGVRNHLDQLAQELGRDHLARLLMELDIGELGGPVDGHEQAQFAFSRLHFRDVDVEIAQRVALELCLRRLVAFDLRKSADAVPLQTAMEGGPCQMRDRRLKGVEAIIKRQERMTPKGHDDRLILQRQHRGMRIFRARQKIGD